MGGKLEINDGSIVISHPCGKIIFGCNGFPEPDVALPELSTEEKIYGRNLCLLPTGWDDLSGDEAWIHYVGEQLKRLWSKMEREEKMAVAYAINELVDDLTSRSIEAAGY